MRPGQTTTHKKAGNGTAPIRMIFTGMIIIAGALLLFSCSPTWTPVCRHNAMLAAIVVGEQYPVRIVSGTTATGRHAQAQAYIAPSWIWLGVDKQGHVWAVDMDSFTPDSVFTVDEYFNKNFGGQQWR